MSKFLSLKKMLMAERRDNDRCTGCSWQCVKYAASSACREGSSFSSLRLSSMRSALQYSRAIVISCETPPRPASVQMGAPCYQLLRSPARRRRGPNPLPQRSPESNKLLTSFTSSTSLRVSTTTSGMVVSSCEKSFSASVNFPSVTWGRRKC